MGLTGVTLKLARVSVTLKLLALLTKSQPNVVFRHSSVVLWIKWSNLNDHNQIKKSVFLGTFSIIYNMMRKKKRPSVDRTDSSAVLDGSSKLINVCQKTR